MGNACSCNNTESEEEARNELIQSRNILNPNHSESEFFFNPDNLDSNYQAKDPSKGNQRYYSNVSILTPNREIYNESLASIPHNSILQSARITEKGLQDYPPYPAQKVLKMNGYSKEALASLLENNSTPYEPICTNSHYKSNVIHGPYKYIDGRTYKGQYINGLECGVGEEITQGGSGYLGNWEYGEKHGIGRLVRSNGDYYLGNFSNNLANGTGMFIERSSSTSYEGEFINNLKHGNGKEILKDGSVYEGNFSKGDRHGEGKITYSDGSIYEGQFMTGKISGIGKSLSSEAVY